MSRHPIPYRRRCRRMAAGWTLVAILGITACILMWILFHPQRAIAEEAEPEAPEEACVPIPEEPPINALSEDVLLLAKIMEKETRAGWPDWMVMCVGEVVMNRVASPLFPDSIRGVLYQNGPIQYAPVWAGDWDSFTPRAEYIDLARRLLNGERALNDPDVVWQALFPQGTKTVLTYHDKVLGNTTYFCS